MLHYLEIYHSFTGIQSNPLLNVSNLLQCHYHFTHSLKHVSFTNFSLSRYYEFDDSVIRELLGKKLSSRHRKDLDEVSEKTNVTLKSCRRQFDNIKRVFKMVEELPGNLMQNIKCNFLLSDELSRYSFVAFAIV